MLGQTFITNTTPIDEKRYSEYDGSPYLFEEHKTVDLYLIGDSKPYSVMLNINMQEKEVKVFKGSEYAVINFNEVESIDAGESGKIVPDTDCKCPPRDPELPSLQQVTARIEMRAYHSSLGVQVVAQTSLPIHDDYMVTL